MFARAGGPPYVEEIRGAKLIDNELPAPLIDPAGDYAKFVTELSYGDIPAEVLDLLKQRLLDTLACMVAGSNETGVTALVDYARECGGTPQSTIIVYGDQVPAGSAAFTNGPMARALDMGDCHAEGQHISEYVVPVLFALAEAGKKVSGRRFLEAYCVGGEIQARIGNACFGLSGLARYRKTVNYTQWGAICAGAKLLELDFETTWNAIGIGYSITGSSDFQCVAEGNQMVRMKHAFTCADAVHSLALARRGIVGTRQVFLGGRGFLATQYPLKNDPARLLTGLGTQWEWLDTFTKAYACCYGSHAAITGTLNLLRQHKIEIDAIERIECGMHPTSLGLVAEPRERKWHPATATEAQFSHPFCLASAVIKGQLLPPDYAPEERARKDIRDLMDRITVHARPEDSGTFAATVNVVTKGGASYEQTIDQPYGSRGNPLGWDGEIDKFRTCCGLAARSIPARSIDAAIEMCRRLEELDDVAPLMRLLVGT